MLFGNKMLKIDNFSFFYNFFEASFLKVEHLQSFLTQEKVDLAKTLAFLQKFKEFLKFEYSNLLNGSFPEFKTFERIQHQNAKLKEKTQKFKKIIDTTILEKKEIQKNLEVLFYFSYTY